ncbi:MAG: FG-GAP-like repeat-containing protein [Gammaproteobacteria bacterium]|nr:FG-GAP-like repeat-containing protein [Gammaproteobacteria bacterium]
MLAVGLAVASCKPDVGARNDRAVGLMGQYDYAAAVAEFQAVVDAAPNWLDARINLAIATLNRQNEGDERLALGILAKVLEADPDEPRALYVSGILHYYMGEIVPARDYFERVVEIDPEDAHAAYFLGLVHLQAADNIQAAEWLVRSTQLDPHLLSGYYTGSQALRRSGRSAEADELLETYLRLKPNPAAHLAEIAYRRMGPKAEALAASPVESPRPAAVEGPLFGAPRQLADAVFDHDHIGTADVDGDGRQDVVLSGNGAPWVLAGSVDGEFTRLADHPLSTAGRDAVALWADIDDDGNLDVVFCGQSGTVVLRQEADEGSWSEAQVLGAEPCSAAAVADADHDADLDVLVTGPSGTELYSNNRDGSFRALAREMGFAGEGGGRQTLFADLDGDRDLDIVIVNGDPPHDIWQNDRTWQYHAMPGLEDFRGTSLVAVTVVDADADGHRELYGLASAGDVYRWRYDGRSWVRNLLLAGSATSSVHAAGELDFADFNGDGRGELLRVLADGFAIVDPRSGAVLHAEAVSNLVHGMALVLDAAQGPSVLAVHGPALSIWPPRTGRHAFMAITPTGRNEVASPSTASPGQMRSNASGIGTGVRVRVAGRWTVLDRMDVHSGRGQSLQPLSFGLGGHDRADFVRLDWTDGVSQTELDLEAGRHHVIEEIQRQLASCPVLFAWNGKAFEFVSDVLGGAALGYLDAPGRYAPPRPVEGFLLNAASLVARDGRYALKLAEPMEENAYLDSARLTVYDLPPGWDIVLDERLAAGGAAATGRHITFRRAVAPVSVTTADGSDVTELATAKDRRAPPPGELDPRFIGLLQHDQELTLEFAHPLDPEGAVLVADGWIEYPYSQTVFAAWQAGVRYRPATLEARNGEGEWIAIAEEFGYPAGMPRTMALPLPKLPPGTDALRLRSNMEIYWDRLRVVWEEALEDAVTATLDPVTARVARTGFAKRTTGPQRLPHYDYAKRSPYWDAKAPEGLYTSFGDARELVRDTDGALAIISSGEEVHLEFEAPPEPPLGHARFFRIAFHGWAKDMDLYTLDGDTLDPMPVPEGADPGMLAKRDSLHARYNVRFRQGL